jgi:hypothetical protein
MNLIESGGINNFNQINQSKTFLQLASDNNIGVLVNRPLNAISKNKIIRLADYAVTEDRNEKEIFSLIDDLADQEKYLIEKYVNYIEASTSEKQNVIDCVSIAEKLKSNYSKFKSVSEFHDIKQSYLIPRANFAVSEIGKNYPNDEGVIRSLRNYAVTINILLDSVLSNLAKIKNLENERFHKAIDKFANSEQQKLSLSQKAILLINSVPQVSSTLVGMRNMNYIEDVQKSIKSEFIKEYVDFWHSNSFSFQ